MERLPPGRRLALPVGASPQITICRFAGDSIDLWSAPVFELARVDVRRTSTWKWVRIPGPLLKRQSPDSQGWGEPKTYCCSSTFRSSVFCVYVARPTVYPVFYYNRKNGIRQTFLSINRHLILEIKYSKAIFNRDDKMFRKTLLPDTNIFLTTAEVPFCGTQGRRHLTLLYEAFASFFLCPSQITSHPNTTDPQKSII